MKAMTVRLNGQLVCFGPLNGMYAPTIPEGAVSGVEDYDAVVTEWRSRPAPLDKKALLFANPLVPQWFKDYLT